MKAMIQRIRKATAVRLRRTAMRIDPPTEPYGEWDAKTGQLVVKIPTNGGQGNMPLARVNISAGMISDTRS